MKNSNFGMAALLALAFLLSACVPAATTEAPTASPVAGTAEPPTPTPVPVRLSGPTAGTVMLWMDGSALVYVPAGEFTMGADGPDNPRHGVSLSAYWITRTKITNRMYALCVGVGVCTPPKPVPGAAIYTDPAFADHPVVGVTWEQADAYCGWAGGRLPTEAEWEKAARGTGGQTYPWGEASPSCDRLNFNNCKGATSSVVAYPASASPYGALDMAGNVFEWVRDWYGADYYAAAPIQDPPGPESGLYKVTRGSGFESEPAQVASAVRHYGSTVYTSRDLGFRCVVAQPIHFPPYCQASPYQPADSVPTLSVCEAPVSELRGQYCKADQGFATVDVPAGSTYTVETPKYKCVETPVDGVLRLTCSGPDSTTGEITVCNPNCGNAIPSTGQSAVCDPGYTYDPATRQCLYTPLVGLAGPQGCPPGYALDPAAGQLCRPTLGLDNQCPSGQYFDTLFGGCVPANGQVQCNLYGLDNSSLAGACYPGCPAGFSLDANAQCCQAPAVGLYPKCQTGYIYDAALGGCVVDLAQASQPGCSTVFVDILQCGPLYDCGQYTTESVCNRNQVYGCIWDDKINLCVNEK